jgi:hypothetical protein
MLKHIADTYEPSAIDALIAQVSPSVSMDADKAFEIESREYGQKLQIAVRNEFEGAT